jgi:hypothetical protein
MIKSLEPGSVKLMPKMFWNEERRQILSDLRGKRTPHEEIAKSLGTTPLAVRQACTRFRIRANRVNPLWSEDQESFLVEKAGFWTVPRIAKRLGRSEKAIYRRASDLGLSLKTVFDCFPLCPLARLFGCSFHSLVKAVKSGHLKAKRRGDRYGSLYVVRAKSAVRFYQQFKDSELYPFLRELDQEVIDWIKDGGMQ